MIPTQTDTSLDYPLLQPLTSSWMHQLMDHPKVLNQILKKYGSPVNIHQTGPFIINQLEYAKVFEDFGLKHLVLFARKANKCKTFVEVAAHAGFGVDTASYKELKQSLELGCPPDKLVFTAAIKTEKALRFAIKNQVLIILDNHDEVELVKRLAQDMELKAKIGFRVSGFHFEGKKLYSRFGFDIEEAFDYINRLFSNSSDTLEYRGLHFHLDGYSPQQRGAAMHACIDLAEKLSNKGLETHFLDIGGGLLINYLKDKNQWNAFERELKAAVRNERPPITFGNNGLGYEVIDGQLKGRMKVYPYYNEKPRAVFLEEILDCENDSGQTVARRALKLNLEIRMEPGRSLLDQCGITVARVAHRKTDSLGELLVGLEMNMTQMYSSSADFLLDPVVIHQNPQENPQTTAVYFTGAYCLERDVLLKRKIILDQSPEIGDLVIFVNTAGYMMHFFESEAHLFDLAPNLFFDNSQEKVALKNFKKDQ